MCWWQKKQNMEWEVTFAQQGTEQAQIKVRTKHKKPKFTKSEF